MMIHSWRKSSFNDVQTLAYVELMKFFGREVVTPEMIERAADHIMVEVKKFCAKRRLWPMPSVEILADPSVRRFEVTLIFPEGWAP